MIWMILIKLFKPAAIKGAGMVILQVLRVFSIITLLAITTSCWVLIIKVNKDRAYFVFECTSLFFTSIISLFLMVSELPMKAIQSYYRKTWPVLSDYHGHLWIGLAMVMIGCNILGNLNKPASATEELGSHFSKLVLASAILSLIFGMLYIICSLILRDGKEGINSRDIRDHGSLAKNGRETLPDYSSSTGSSPPYFNEKTPQGKVMGFLWGKAKEKTGEKKFNCNRPNISGPFSARQDYERDAERNDRRSPIVPEVRRPDTALHPMNHNVHSRSSMYSEASHLNRI